MLLVCITNKQLVIADKVYLNGKCYPILIPPTCLSCVTVRKQHHFRYPLLKLYFKIKGAHNLSDHRSARVSCTLSLCCRVVTVFPDLSKDDHNIFTTDKNDGCNYENKTRVEKD